MKLCPLLVLVTAWALLTISCGTPSRKAPDAEVCPLHHVPLKSRGMYRISPGLAMVDPSEAYVRVVERFPRRIPWFYSNTPTEISTKRERVRFCPRCESELPQVFR
jgi:hypothetical protein